MTFSRFADGVSAAVNRLSATKSATASFLSHGLPPLAGSQRGSGFSRYGKKKFLRLSSSLQDFSEYCQLDPEDGNLNSETDRSFINIEPLSSSQRENGGASFSKDKPPPGAPPTRKKWVRVILVLLCLLFFALLLFMVQFFYFKWSKASPKYFVILDCGSTGTRAFLYTASANHKETGGLPIWLSSLPEALPSKPNSQSGRAYNRMETEPGFDKLVHNVSGLRGAINPLLKWAEKQIPKHAHKTTSLFLYATAGVRRLPSADSEWLLNNAWSIMKNSSFLCHREWVKIISGMEEAYYGWIALNFHEGVLGAIPKKETFGALDLGGSSLQVTFESEEQFHNETSLQLSIGPVNHYLNAYSLSGYGLNDAFEKSVVHLLKRIPKVSFADLASGNIVIKHPCLHSGYKEKYSCSQCTSAFQNVGSPTTEEKKIGNRGKPLVSVQLVGAPKWEECSQLGKIAVNLSEWSDQSPGIDCEMQPCALPDNLPRPHGQFYGISGFYVVYRFFNMTSDAALDDLLEKGRDFCEKPWDIAKNSVAPQPFIEQYCFRAPYIVFLLREGLHITDSNVIIGSGSITWTLGVALMEAGKAFTTKLDFQSYEVLRRKINPTIFFAILFASIFFVVCAWLCVSNWTVRFFRRSYLPIFRHNSGSSTSILNIPATLRFQRWSAMNSGDGRVKMPLSPVASGQNRPFGSPHDFGGGIELTGSSLFSSSSSVAHSYSSGSLGQMQFDSGSMGSFWSPHRSQMRLQSRRSQSREDLSSSLSEAHLGKA